MCAALQFELRSLTNFQSARCSSLFERCLRLVEDAHSLIFEKTFLGNLRDTTLYDTYD